MNDSSSNGEYYGWVQLLITLQHLEFRWNSNGGVFSCRHCLRIGFFPHDCPRDEILPVMSKIWAKLVECGSDIHKRKSAVQLLYAEILTLVTWLGYEWIWYDDMVSIWVHQLVSVCIIFINIDFFSNIFTELMHIVRACPSNTIVYWCSRIKPNL